MVAAGIVVAKLMGEKNGEQRNRKGQAREKGRGMAIGDAKCVEKGIDRGSLVVRIRCGKMRAGDERSNQSEQEKYGSKGERPP